MRVLMIAANTERVNMPAPPLGAAQVAAATRAQGHEVQLLDLLSVPAAIPAVEAAIADLAPEVIGISVRNIDDQNIDDPVFMLERVREVVAACQARTEAPIVLGGAGYSIFPRAVLDYLEADMGVQGEGDLVFPHLVSAMERGEDLSFHPSLRFRGQDFNQRQSRAMNLDTLPSPYADLVPDFGDGPLDWMPIQSRRGCPLRCSYCSTELIEGRTPRMRTPSKVATEIAGLAVQGVRRLHFVDNTFNLPASYALELCRRIRDLETPLEWRAIIYPYKVPEKLTAAMAEAGCVEVAFGFESGSDRILKSMGKRYTPNDVRQIAARLKSAGIRRTGFLLLGGPGEDRESLAQSLDFAESLELELVKVTKGVRIYPGTEVARQAVKEGVIAPEADLLRPVFYLAPGLDIDTAVRMRSGLNCC